MHLVVLSALAGALLAAPLACIPALHVYNVMGLMVAGLHFFAERGMTVPPEVATPFAAGMVVGYAMLNTLPSVLLAAPDESALFTVLPGQKYLMAGRGYEGVMLTTLGGLAGLLALVLVVGPLGSRVLPPVFAVLRPHMHWIIWCVIAFVLMSEWPKGGRLGQGGWRRFFDSWKSTGAGLLTFLLSGLLGFVLLYRSPISASAAFQNLMPGFVGLFALPWLVVNIISRVEPPPQTTALSAELTLGEAGQGAAAGVLGGGFAAFFPVITGGVGGLLSGHATAIRGDRAFLISQGASKVVYYVGALLLFFVPGLHAARGGAAALLKGFYRPYSPFEYYAILASIALAGAVTIVLVGPLTRGMLWLIRRRSYRGLSSAALALVVVLVGVLTGGMGLAVMVVSAAIGLVPVLFGARRMNGLGIILLPVACNMSGVGSTVAGWLGLVR